MYTFLTSPGMSNFLPGKPNKRKQHQEQLKKLNGIEAKQTNTTKFKRAIWGQATVFFSATVNMSGSESDDPELAGLASLASSTSPAYSLGLGELGVSTSDDDDAAGNEDRPVPLVIRSASAAPIYDHMMTICPLCMSMPFYVSRQDSLCMSHVFAHKT